MSFSFSNPLFRKGRQVRGITGVPHGPIHTYEPFFTNPRHWANFIVGPKESGKFTLVCHWLDEWRRKNRLDRMVLVSSSTSSGRSAGPLGNFMAAVNLNSPDWLKELDALVALKKETAPLETWAIVLDNCFWQPWVLRHRLIRRLVTGGRQARVALFCLFERPPKGLDSLVSDGLDSIVALPYGTLDGWQQDLVALSGGRFVPGLWKEGEHPKHTLWVSSLVKPSMAKPSMAKRGSLPHTVRPLPPRDYVFDTVAPLIGEKAGGLTRKPYGTAPKSKPKDRKQNETKNSEDEARNEPKEVGDLRNKEEEEVPAATWWEAVSSWLPPLPSLGLFSAWSQ